MTMRYRLHPAHPHVLPTLLALFLLVLFLLAAAPIEGQAQDVAEGSLPITDVEEGYASWYSPGYQGYPTASEEPYDHYSFTAAHPSIPLQTRVRVVRVDDGRSVLVRVNDRMQPAPGHIIDLSGAAAAALGLGDEVAVRIQVMPLPSAVTADDGVAPAASSEAPALFTLQLGAFSDRSAAERLHATTPSSWVEHAEVNGRTFYRVYFQRFTDRQAAEKARDELAAQGIVSFVRTL